MVALVLGVMAMDADAQTYGYWHDQGSNVVKNGTPCVHTHWQLDA